jgi:hypothetical protein
VPCTKLHIQLNLLPYDEEKETDSGPSVQSGKAREKLGLEEGNANPPARYG